MRNTYRRSTPRRYYQLNYRIEANQLRVINHEGKQLGVMDKNAALNLARDQELDLVLIAPKAQPPVAKIINFKKFLYQEEKKEKEARKGIKKSTTKDLKLSLFIGPADLERMINKGREFIEAGNQLRLNLMLKGREMAKKPMAFELIKRFIEKLGDVNVSKTPKMEGRVLRAVVAKRK